MKNPPSGKFILRLPKWLHQHLKSEADQSGYSLNELCVRKLESRIEVPPIHPIPVRLLKILTDKWQDFLIGIIHFEDSTPRSRIAFFINSKYGKHLPYLFWDQVSAPFYPLTFEPPVFLFEPKTTMERQWMDVLVSGNIVWDKDMKTARLLRNLRSILIDSYKTRHASQQSSEANTFPNTL